MRLITRADKLDASDIREMIESRAYSLVEARIAKTRDGLMQQLILEADPDEVRRLQGGVRALNQALEVPRIILREVERASRGEFPAP